MVNQHYELTNRDRRKNALLRYGARLSPLLLAIPLPAIFLVLYLIFGTTTNAAAFYIFLALLSAGVGFAIGIILMIALIFYRNAWLRNLREQLATDGIKTNEVDWFTNELTSAERRSLKELDRTNRLLADAYRETLGSRLTATRILKNSKNELLLVERRQNKLKYLKGENTKSLQEELSMDKERLETVRNEAEDLLVESQTRLETIEAAARRGTALAGNEQALKQLSERTRQLPIALEAAKLEEEIRRELENEPNLNSADAKE
jgi:hypothetical protein